MADLRRTVGPPLGSPVVVPRHVLHAIDHAVDTFVNLVLRVLDRLLDLAAGLVRLAGAPQLVIIGEVAGGLLGTTSELVIAISHRPSPVFPIRTIRSVPTRAQPINVRGPDP